MLVAGLRRYLEVLIYDLRAMSEHGAEFSRETCVECLVRPKACRRLGSTNLDRPVGDAAAQHPFDIPAQLC